MGMKVLLCLFVLHICSQRLHYAVAAGSLVKFLPGFNGPLPFHLETGYIGVGDGEEVQLFYYFTKSESNPNSDPLIFWFSGGPGCSSFNGLIYEIGPFAFEPVEYNGRLPRLIPNPYSWTKMANIIFLDLPVGTGFSYATTAAAHQSNTTQACNQAYEFSLKWLNDHPEFKSNPFYVGGDSFGGQHVPIITQFISNGNEEGINPKINLKGYILGNPVTFPGEDNYRFPFAHGMGLISDELYESLTENCKGETFIGKEAANNYNINTSNIKCLNDVQTFIQLTADIQTPMILDPICNNDDKLLRPQPLLAYRRILNDKSANLIKFDKPKCHDFLYELSDYWANDESVREALHIKKGSTGRWIRCNTNVDYIYELGDVIPFHANLSAKGYRSIVYSGDHDLDVPFLSTQAWIRSLNYTIIDDWHPWMLQGQVAGYTRTYSNKMTFATAKGAGHIVPEFKPYECQVMMERWLSYTPL